MATEAFLDIKRCIKGKVLCNEPMSRHTSFRVGGPAEIWVEPEDFDDLRSGVMLAREKNLPVLVVGGGTNLLVRDEGVKGVIISMTSREMRKMLHGDTRVVATSAVRLGEFIKFCVNAGLSGLEFLAGVPGSVGGAVAMNAGGRHYEKKDIWSGIGDLVEQIKAMDYEGNTHLLAKKDLKFGPKSSNLKNMIIVEVKFRLAKQDKGIILGECAKFLKKKKTTQDLTVPSAGCVFKNPAEGEKSSGELIDRCGLKGRRVGGARISQKHANFIVNMGGATFDDIMNLINITRNEVKDKFGIELELEIEIV